MRTLILLLLTVLATLRLTCQSDFVKDSLKIMKPKLVRPQFKFDNRVTFYEGQTLFIRGYDAGVLLANKLRIALGYSSVDADLNAFRQTIDSVDIGRLVKINYGSLNIEFNYLDTRFFTLGMPLELAGGWNALKFKNFTTDQIYRKEEGVLILSHFGLSGTFKPIRWFGLKGTIGYRQMLFSQVKEFNFGGFFTSIGFNVDFREIITDIKMYRLMRKYKHGNTITNTVELISD
jgi:hypothetical protein